MPQTSALPLPSDLESNAGKKGSPLCAGRGALSVTPRPSGAELAYLAYPSEGRAWLGLCVGALRPLGALPLLGQSSHRDPSPYNRGEQRTAMEWPLG